jgi:hypothetical protein
MPPCTEAAPNKGSDAERGSDAESEGEEESNGNEIAATPKKTLSDTVKGIHSRVQAFVTVAEISGKMGHIH